MNKKIKTDLLDKHNDYVILYLIEGDKYDTLTDDCYTLTDLQQSGYCLSKNEKMIRDICSFVGVKSNLDSGELYVHTNEESFGKDKYHLLQAIQYIIKNMKR